MKLIYSRRALADIDGIATYYSDNASPAIAQSIEQRFLDVIDRIQQAPESAPRVSQRSQVRAVTVIRYPFRIFYRVRGDTVEILHIRHTARRPIGGVSDGLSISETHHPAKKVGFADAQPTLQALSLHRRESSSRVTPRSSRRRSSSWSR